MREWEKDQELDWGEWDSTVEVYEWEPEGQPHLGRTDSSRKPQGVPLYSEQENIGYSSDQKELTF